jgi:hypothetical protein
MFKTEDKMQPVSKDFIFQSDLGSILSAEENEFSPTQKYMYLKMSSFKGVKVELVRLCFNAGTIDKGIIFYKEYGNKIYSKLIKKLTKENGEPCINNDNYSKWDFGQGYIELFNSITTPVGTILNRYYIYMTFSKV